MKGAIQENALVIINLDIEDVDDEQEHNELSPSGDMLQAASSQCSGNQQFDTRED